MSPQILLQLYSTAEDFHMTLQRIVIAIPSIWDVWYDSVCQGYRAILAGSG